MSEETHSATATNGDASSTAPPDAAPLPEAKVSAAVKLTTHPKVQQAIALAKTHPLGAVATVAAAAALVEVEFAVGILTGLGATALLASQTGPEARERVLLRGKKALARVRVALAQRRKAAVAVVPPPVSAEPAPPPVA